MIFKVGTKLKEGRIRYEVIQGRKDPRDGIMVIETAGPVWVPMSHMAILTSFHYQIEDILYKDTGKGRGGEYFLEKLGNAARFGHEGFTEELNRQKLAKEQNEYIMGQMGPE